MLGNKLAELRKKKKLTQEDAAKRIGIPRSTYSNYESGKREPDLETLKLLADLYEVSTDYLTGAKNKASNKYEPALKAIIEKSEELGLDLSDPRTLEMMERILEVIAVKDEK